MGQRVSIAVGAFPNRTFGGVVTFVAPVVDPATRTLRVKAEVDNSEALLRPGLFARVNLGVARRENVLMVPAEALLQRAGGASLYRLIDGDRVERVAVESGAMVNDMIEVRGDVREGDRIIRSGHGGLADGMTVVVREGAPPPMTTAGTGKRGKDS